MAATPPTKYLPAAEVAKVQDFLQFTTSDGVTQFNTDLTGAFGTTAGTIQVSADAQVSGNALVVVNDNIVFSVPPNSWVTYHNGRWAQYTAPQLAAGFVQYFTS